LIEGDAMSAKQESSPSGNPFAWARCGHPSMPTGPEECVTCLKLQVRALQAVAEAAKSALGCCDYGCEKFDGCDHKNCCSNDAKVIEALRAAGYTEKPKCAHD
jgi:hypothetical protein